MSRFIGNEDMDLKILESLDDTDLYNSCHTNKYIQNLCFNDEQLYMRLRNMVPLFIDPDMDYVILSYLNDDELYQVYLSNKDAAKLISNSKLVDRIKRYKQVLFNRASKMFDKARWQKGVYISIQPEDVKEIRLTKDDIHQILQGAKNVDVYKYTIHYTMYGTNLTVYQSIKTIVEALGYEFNAFLIHPRIGLGLSRQIIYGRDI